MTLTERLHAIVQHLPAGSSVTLPTDAVREWLSAEPAAIDARQSAAPVGRSLTVSEVAELLQASERWVRNHRSDLGGFGTRRLLRFNEIRVRRWMERNQK